MSRLSPSASAVPLVTSGTAIEAGAGRCRRTGAVAPEPGFDGERRHTQQRGRANVDAVVHPVKSERGAHGALRRGRGPRGTAGLEPLEDTAEPGRGVERPSQRNGPIPAGGPIGGAQKGGRTIDHVSARSPAIPRYLAGLSLYALHFI